MYVNVLRPGTSDRCAELYVCGRDVVGPRQLSRPSCDRRCRGTIVDSTKPLYSLNSSVFIVNQAPPILGAFLVNN